MKAGSILGVVLCAASCCAMAQRADCPRRDVPMPSRPPQMPRTPPENGTFPVEEGHVSAILQVEQRAKKGPVPQTSANVAADVASTPLGEWAYEGYLPESSPYRVTRFFRAPDGSLLALSEWDYKAEMGDIDVGDMGNRTIGGRPAGLFALRSPSGCVSTSLTWKDERKLNRLEIVGPLDADRQREAVTRIGEALAR